MADAYADTPAHLWPIAKLSLEMHLEKLEREGLIVRVSAAEGGADGPLRAATFRVV